MWQIFTCIGYLHEVDLLSLVYSRHHHSQHTYHADSRALPWSVTWHERTWHKTRYNWVVTTILKPLRNVIETWSIRILIHKIPVNQRYFSWFFSHYSQKVLLVIIIKVWFGFTFLAILFTSAKMGLSMPATGEVHKKELASLSSKWNSN